MIGKSNEKDTEGVIFTDSQKTAKRQNGIKNLISEF